MGVDPAANTLAGFQHDRLDASHCEIARGSQARRAGADYQN